MKARVIVGVLGLASLLGASGCGADASGKLSACDPLGAQPEPIALGVVVAAGKDDSGTIYVADHDPKSNAEDRVFVSNGDTLERRRVTGSGSGGDTDFTWSFEDGTATQRLVAHIQAGKVTNIALASPDQKTFVDKLGADAQTLMPVDASELSQFKLRNLPGDIVLEYVADVEDGSRIVVTRPRDDWTYADFRVFYGRGDALVERVVHNVGRGSFTLIDFVVNGAEFHATFTSSLAPAVTSQIVTSTGTLALTTLEPPLVPAGVMFQCLD